MLRESQIAGTSGEATGELDQNLPLHPKDDVVAGGVGRGARTRIALAAVVVGATTLALHASGTVASTGATFEVMGFDPDRGRLLADLVGAGMATAAGALLTGAVRTSALAGIVGGSALFAHTFIDETRAATTVYGPDGTFDPLGWALTLLTLVVAFAVVAWATASLTRTVRGWLLEGGKDLAAFARSGRRAGRLRRPAALLAVAALLVVTLPIFADMVNFSPDAHMRDGSPASVGLTQPGASAAQPRGASGGSPPPASGAPGQVGDGTGTALGSGAPWTAWKPAGQGQTVTASFPAPWTGGLSTTAKVEVYLPPGYGSSPRAYPVVYAVPWASYLWTRGAGITTMLDTMITAGTFPASIVVFIAQEGGAYSASECVNAVDGREWFETYITSTVVPYVDTTFRTIKNSSARSVLGFSQGGFCSTMLVLRHPDLFSTAISMSGYYQAGILSNQTPNAYRVFGGNPTIEAQYSPLELVGKLSPALRPTVFLILEGDPTDPFYGTQYEGMVAACRSAGVAVSAIQSPARHGWPAVRSSLPQMLVALAQRQAALGVFS
jgi:S-formylglutathione hydrolase FrmB